MIGGSLVLKVLIVVVCLVIVGALADPDLAGLVVFHR
jgi:hypothetical protein